MLQEDWEYYWNAAGMLHLQEYCRNTAGIKNTAEIVDEYCGNTAAILQEYLNTTGILQICAGILRESDRNTAGILHEYCRNTAGMLQEYCRRAAGILDAYCKNTAGIL